MQGYIQVYTGDGKGKTTAAMGLAVRAAGAGLRVFIAQFAKGRYSSEYASLAKLDGSVRIERFGGEGFIVGEPTTDDIAHAHDGLASAREAMLEEGYDVIILDEANTAVLLGLLTENELLEFINLKPDTAELVLTGRGAPDAIIERADLVTEMRMVKHYYDAGVGARTGIEE